MNRYCIGDTLIVRAIKSIAKGEMIAENYGPIFTQKTKEYRQRILKERYWFECNCTPCKENWPLFSDMSMDIFKFRCTTSSCGRALVVHSDTLTPFITCPSCKKNNNMYLRPGHKQSFVGRRSLICSLVFLRRE